MRGYASEAVADAKFRVVQEATNSQYPALLKLPDSSVWAWVGQCQTILKARGSPAGQQCQLDIATKTK
jgi:hypothetical protein